MLNIIEVEGKSEEEIHNKIEKEYGLENVVIKEKEEKGGLIGKKNKYMLVKKEELADFLTTTIEEIGQLMENPTKAFVEIEDHLIKIKLDSENNGIMIGKNGRNLHAFQYLLNQIMWKELGRQFKISLDIADYKEERKKMLERDIRFIADDVVATKVGVKLDYMNSYERRIVHSIINDYEELETRSEGENPERFINIIYKEKEE